MMNDQRRRGIFAAAPSVSRLNFSLFCTLLQFYLFFAFETLHGCFQPLIVNSARIGKVSAFFSIGAYSSIGIYIHSKQIFLHGIY